MLVPSPAPAVSGSVDSPFASQGAGPRRLGTAHLHNQVGGSLEICLLVLSSVGPLPKPCSLWPLVVIPRAQEKPAGPRPLYSLKQKFSKQNEHVNKL